MHGLLTIVFFVGWLNHRCFQPIKEIVTVKAPVKCRKSPAGYTMENLDVLDPFGLIHYLWNVIGIDVSESQVRQFWQHNRARGCRWAVHSQSSERTMPLGIYGDAVKIRSTYQGIEKMQGIFLSVPLFRPRSVRCSRWLLFCCQEELLFGHHTLDCVLRYLTWAFNQLHTGKYPTCGPNGEAPPENAQSKSGKWICEKERWTFQITEIQGDWQWHKIVFRFHSSWKGGSNLPVCFKCKCFTVGDPGKLYYHVEEHSQLWTTEYPTVADFIAEQCPDDPCALAAVHWLKPCMISNFYAAFLWSELHLFS